MIKSLAAAGTLFLAGCASKNSNLTTTTSEPDTSTQTKSTSETDNSAQTSTTQSVALRLSGSPVKQSPDDVSPAQYPSPELESKYLTKVVNDAVSAAKGGNWGKSFGIKIPPNDTDEFEEKYSKIPASKSHGGNYVENSGYIVQLILFLYE